MTSVMLAPATAPAHALAQPLRVVPAPASAPPFDDEVAASPQLRLVAPTSAPLAPPRPPSQLSPFDDDAWLTDGRTPAAELPPAEEFTRRLVQVLLEVVAGVRPVNQLRRDTTPELYVSVRAAVLCRPRPTGPRPDRRAIRSVHVQTRLEGVAEACVTVRRGPRVTALALRLEGVDGRWRCTELDGAARV